MNRWLVLVAIVFSIAVTTALPGYSSVQSVDQATSHWTGVPPVKDARLAAYAALESSPQSGGSFRLAKEVDLREVDWGKVADAKDANQGKAAVNAPENGNGDDEEDEDDDGGDEEGEEDKEDEDEGGWDRTWDSPKLG